MPIEALVLAPVSSTLFLLTTKYLQRDQHLILSHHVTESKVDSQSAQSQRDLDCSGPPQVQPVFDAVAHPVLALALPPRAACYSSTGQSRRND